jgi:phenylacetate-CoA ligase
VLDLLLRLSGSEVPACLAHFRRLEEASPAVVDEYQRLMLLRLLRHARDHVPYYRRLIEEHRLDLSEHFTVREIEKLPLLTRDRLREHKAELVSDDARGRRTYWNSSGGSTGSPVEFLQDRAYRDRNVIAAKLLYNELLGKAPGEREVNLWGSVRDIERGRLDLKARCVNFLYNRRFQNFFRVNDETLARYVREINDFRPVSLWAYVQALELIAKFIRRERLEIHSPRLIISTAGPLYEDVRQLVESVFRCPVYSQYGCREAGAVAIETFDRDGLRGFPYLNHVELVEGSVVVTPLTNYSMPLLRYELGDTAEPWTGPVDERYGCRRKILKSITGRVHSHFRNARGDLVYGGWFAIQFFSRSWVRNFQVVQDALDHVTCHIVPVGEPVPRELDEIRERIRSLMGASCEVAFNFTDEITPPPSGKHQHTICRL